MIQPKPPTATDIAAQIVIDRYCDSNTIIEFALRDVQASGSHPFSDYFSTEFPIAPRELLDERWVIVRAAQAESGIAVLAVAGDAVVHICTGRHGTTVTCVAGTLHRLATLTAGLKRASDELLAELSSSTCKVRVWHAVSGGMAGRFNDRRLTALSWPSTADNYPALTRGRLNRLLSNGRPDETTGRLILWHGEPGTGKTSAARALMRAWEPWCAAHYITDPDQFFQRADYIAEVLAQPGDTDRSFTVDNGCRGQAPWKLVIAEDCDEYLRASASQRAGASLGRLLNLTDGLLGQGTNTLVLLTTNEPLGRLHPAITRPGRCLDVTEFVRFTPVEATHRLRAPTTADMTLAEIYQRINSDEEIVQQPSLLTGQYL